MKLFFKTLVLTLLLSNCAQQVPPNGGPKDELPPKVLGARPHNKTTGFTADKIVIKFDEYVELRDKEQIIISPILKNKLIETDRKTIIVSFPRTKPEPNTTYTINFGNSITDNHESAAIENYSYTFSTGTFLDSNRIQGTVLNAFNNKFEKGIVVGIYPEEFFTDSTLAKIYPTYFAKTNAKGEFKIENLPGKKYYLFAFKDDNSDIKYTKNEPVSFVKESITATVNTDAKKLFIYKPLEFNPNKMIDSLAKQKGKFQFVFYMPKEISITPHTKLKYYIHADAGRDFRDTFSIFIPGHIDSVPLLFTIITKDTTFQTHLKTRNRAKLPEFSLSSSSSISLTDSIKILSSTPIDSLTPKHILFVEDTLIVIPKYFKEINKMEWVLYHPFKELTNYTVHIKDSVIKDVFGRFNKELKQSISTKSSKDYGNLILTVKLTLPGNYLVQLVEDNDAERVLYTKSITESTDILFKNISPVVVKVKVISDTNKNGKWDEGDLKLKIYPERVYYHNQPITIKAYWDIEHMLDLDKLLIN
ncbi:MAG: Ig-like domain-containing protein [Bacteroidota bacterium]|nr:Ig-like domain-containing protein [Bacteroidota bacterium]